jgi:phytanoyl-CoA hydroxylase
MKAIYTPNKILVNVPENDLEDVSPKFEIKDFDEAEKYYIENGYVIFKDLINLSDIDDINLAWDEEVKPSKSFIYRQANARAEKHLKNEYGWIMNPILNLQSVSLFKYPRFRKLAVNNIFSSKNLVLAYKKFLNDDPKVVQSMFFEGNSETWEHQDTYYLDSENLGKMIGSWIALEDIDADAGRFFICPKSHTLDLGKQSSENNVADKHEVYIKNVVSEIKKRKMEIRAPKLNKGDVLFWNSWTIHGSLKSNSKTSSRRSITNHVIPNQDLFLKLQSIKLDINTDFVKGIYLYRPKDQYKFKNRVIMFIESYFPRPFYFIKKILVKLYINK